MKKRGEFRRGGLAFFWMGVGLACVIGASPRSQAASVGWGAYLGSPEMSSFYAVALDASNNVYVVGTTAQAGWVSGGWDTSHNGSWDAFAVKFSPTGEHLWSTYIGGDNSEAATAVAVDGAGNVFVGGNTQSSGWTSGGWDTSFNGSKDAFMIKFSPTGEHLWSTYIGGDNVERATAVAVDGAGNVFVGGDTLSSGWVDGGWDTLRDTPVNNVAQDGFVVKLSPSGAHVWSTYIGGAVNETLVEMAVDSGGNVFATGLTWSSGWISGGWRPAFGGGVDGYLVKLSPSGQHRWSTYLGGGGDDNAFDLAVSPGGESVVVGASGSAGWVSGGWDTVYNSRRGDPYPPYSGTTNEGFAVKLSPTGGHVWSTYLGAAGWDCAKSVFLGAGGDVYISGITQGCNWVSGGGNVTRTGEHDGFLVRLSSAGAHLWSTYLGGLLPDNLVVGGDGCTYLEGQVSSGWGERPPLLVGGGWDAPEYVADRSIVTKISPAGAHVWSSCVQGQTNGVALFPDGALCITGTTNVSGWLPGTPDITFEVGEEIDFIARVRDTDGVGSLTVTVDPPEASGTLWRVAGQPQWRSAGETVSGLEAGEWCVEFNDLPGFARMERRTVTVPAGGTAVLEETCVPVPVDIEWGSYLSGRSAEAVEVDGSGNLHVAGAFSGGWCNEVDVFLDAYVMKLSPAGGLIWSTHFGGPDGESCLGVAVDGMGNVFAVGSTDSDDWVSGGWDTVCDGACDYLMKLSPDGDILWSTYLENVDVLEVAADAAGNAHVTGRVTEAGWISGGWDTTPNGSLDGFAAKFSPAGAHLWSTYFGGTGQDRASDIAVDAAGQVYVAGHTTSAGWVSGGWNTTYNSAGNGYGYLLRLNPAGAHVWSTYLGSWGGADAVGVGVDDAGDVYVGGNTGSGGWVSGGGDTSYGGDGDGYAAKFTPSGAHVWSTYIGASEMEIISAFSVDAGGRVSVTGTTRSAGWMIGGWETEGLPELDHPFVLQLSPSGVQEWASYLRGTGTGVAASDDGAVVVVGSTSTPGWLYGGLEETLRDYSCAYVAQIARNPLPMPPANPGAVVGTDWITWTWEDTVSAETGFRVWSDPGVARPETLRTTTAPDVFSWTQTGLSPNTAHTFQVAAVNASGDSVRTSPVTAWTLAMTPAAPALSRAMGTTLDLAVGAGDGNPVNVEYALRCVTTGEWVQADGGLDAAPVWQPAGNWGTVRVTGLAGLTEYFFDVTARNGAGVETAPGPSASATTLEDTPPTGTVTINGGAAVTSSPAVTLSLTYDDGAGSGVAEMRFSHDGLAWTGWEAVAPTRAWTLTPGDAPKTVYVQYRDAAENVSAGPISDGILLDAENPSAVVTLADPTPTQATTLRYAVTFSEAVAPTFDVSDVSLTGALSGTVAVTGTDPAYTVTVTLAGVAPDGLTGIQLGTGVQDVLGKPFAGAVSPDYDVVWWPGFASANPPVRGYTGDAGPVLDAALRPGGARTPSWQWYWDRGTDGLPELGPATAQWDVGVLSPLKTGEYWCLVSYGGLVFETDHAGLDVADRITITRHPQDQEVSPGRSATFTTEATGGFPPLHYQWKHDGENAPDSPDLPVFMLLNMSAGDTGEYTVEVSDSHADTAVSESATLTLGPPLPVAGLAGLAALAAVLVLAGRRRK